MAKDNFKSLVKKRYLESRKYIQLSLFEDAMTRPLTLFEKKLRNGNFIDRRGTRIEDNLIIDFDEEATIKRSNGNVWKVKCKCGNIFSSTYGDLTREDTNRRINNCGKCVKKNNQWSKIKNYYDYQLEQYVFEHNDFILIGLIENYTDDNRRSYLCRCKKCNKELVKQIKQLREMDYRHNCDYTGSWKERQIEDFLKKKKISFSTQVIFEDCKMNPKKAYAHPCKFDFKIYRNDRT